MGARLPRSMYQRSSACGNGRSLSAPEAPLGRTCDSLELRAGTELDQDRPDVRSHGGVADAQPPGHGPVVRTLDHQGEDLLLSGRQALEQRRVPGVLPGAVALPGEGAG